MKNRLADKFIFKMVAHTEVVISAATWEQRVAGCGIQTQPHPSRECSSGAFHASEYSLASLFLKQTLTSASLFTIRVGPRTWLLSPSTVIGILQFLVWIERKSSSTLVSSLEEHLGMFIVSMKLHGYRPTSLIKTQSTRYTPCRLCLDQERKQDDTQFH